MISDNMNQQEILEQQRKLWDQAAPGWKKWDGFTMEFLNPIGEKILDAALLKDGYYVLDVATGTGSPGLNAAKRIPKGKVIGIDLSEEMVNLANEKARKLGIKNYEARIYNAGDLPFDDNSFDAVVCRFGIMFFPDMLSGLKELVRVLKPGKRVSLSVWNVPEKNPWTAVRETIHEMLDLPLPPVDAPGMFRCSKPGTLTSLFNEAGLKDVKEIEVTGKINFDSAEQYWNFTTEVAAPITMALAKADEATRERVKQTTINAIKAEANEKISFDWSAWVAWGVK